MYPGEIYMSRMTAGFGLLVTVALLFFTVAHSQELPKTVWVKVTYYDFHSDRSNPEFEAPHTGAVRKGMVGEMLGSDHKPVAGNSPYLNYYIKKWFTPFKKGDFSVPVYYPRASYKSKTISTIRDFNEFTQEVSYEGAGTESHDTSFSNKVIKDSLRFDLQDNGMYQFRDDDFFPLDRRGFGNEWNYHSADSSDTGNHNYSFTMELNWKFVMREGLVFHFSGDDDVWVFINNKLRLDLGGIHNAQVDSIILDDIEGLNYGETYSLDVFYAERHSSESHLWITSNIFSVPSNLFIYGKAGEPNTIDNMPLGPSDSISVGVPYPLYAHVLDSLERWKPEYDSLITWEISSPENGTLSSINGSSTVVTAKTYNSQLTVTARFINPENGKESQKSMVFYVRKESALNNYTIKLYKNPGDVTILTPIGPSDTAGYMEPYPVYGHVFDNNGNWLFEYDSQLSWDISPENYGQLSNKDGDHTVFTATTPNAQVVLTSKVKNPGNQNEFITCSIILFTRSAPPPAQYILKLYSNPNDPESVLNDYDTIAIDFSDTIFGHVFDTSGKPLPEYDKKLVWNASPDNAGSLQPQTDSFTIFRASKFDTYVTVNATFSDPEDTDRKFTRKVTLYIRKAPAPYILKLYSQPGDPGLISSLGDSVTVTAGQKYTVYGHIFDTNGVWIPRFDQEITWQMMTTEKPSTLNPLKGNSTTFQSMKTGIYTLMANFADTTSTSRPPSVETLYIKVIHDNPYSLHIQRDTLISLTPQPFDTLIFHKNDKTAKIYAIIRDQYGNFISCAESASWQSMNIDIADLSPVFGYTTTVTNKGKSTSLETYIIVSQNGLIPDTILVMTTPRRMTAVLPNPFTPGKDDIRNRIPQGSKTWEFYENILEDVINTNPYVTLIAIQTELPLLPVDSKPPKDATYGSVFVYDAVGNVIRRDLKLRQAAGSIYTYVVTWDGKNENFRTVGRGTYLFMINGKMSNNGTFKNNIKVGVDRR